MQSFSLPALNKTQLRHSFRRSADSFIVCEIDEEGRVWEGPPGTTAETEKPKQHLYFLLKKKDWATVELLKKAASRLRISYKRFAFAGNKDKRATTYQLVSVYNLAPKQLTSLSISDAWFYPLWYRQEPLKLGSLLGNRFIISHPYAEEVHDIVVKTKGWFPNYFGHQRFGSVRQNTHLIGEAIIHNNLRRAIELYLDREGLFSAEKHDYGKMLERCPKYMRFERVLLHHLAHHPRDYANALRQLPKQLLLMFIHAFQSHLFNIALAERVKEGEVVLEEGERMCGTNAYGFPDLNEPGDMYMVGKLIGYETKINEREKEILERFYITPSDFRLVSMPELSSKGGERVLLCRMLNPSLRPKDVFCFDLPAGSYATVALKEVFGEVE